MRKIQAVLTLFSIATVLAFPQAAGAAASAARTAAGYLAVGPAQCLVGPRGETCVEGAAAAPTAVSSEASAPAPEPSAKPQPEGGGEGSQTVPPGFRFFSPTSFWNRPLPGDAPLDPDSAALVGELNELVASEIAAERGPSINTARWSVPLYTVPADQPTVRVADTSPSGFSPALQAAWEEVPLPPDAQPAAGTDGHLVVWQPSTDRLWEFWRLVHEQDGSWSASWGGAMEQVSSNQGVYSPEAWPGATNSWGGSASSLSLAGGLITLEDLERGKIEHALALSSPEVRAGVYSLPAHRTDGLTDSPLALPEGAHLRLDPNLDLESLGLPPFTLMLAKAAQRYGIILRSQGSVVDFFGQDPTPTGTNPYRGPDGYFEGKLPGELLAYFPWEHLQLLRMELREQP